MEVPVCWSVTVAADGLGLTGGSYWVWEKAFEEKVGVYLFMFTVELIGRLL